MSVELSLSVNGKAVAASVDPRTLLVELIRSRLALTGTHVGCDTGQCGACTVLVDGRAVKSCTMLAVQANGAQVTTIEGVASGGKLSAVQEAFLAEGGAQCGICTPGMVLAATSLLAANPTPTEEDIRTALAGSLCRCTGYMRIFASVVRACQAGGR